MGWVQSKAGSSCTLRLTLATRCTHYFRQLLWQLSWIGVRLTEMSQPAGQYRMSWCPGCWDHTPYAGPSPCCLCRGLLCRTGSSGAASGRYPCSSLQMSTAYGPSVRATSPSFARGLHRNEQQKALANQHKASCHKKHKACHLHEQKHTFYWLQRHMPKSRRLPPLYCQKSTEEDILPRVSQERRLFSNLDRSMKHETGSVGGAIVLIAGEYMHGV